MNTLIEKMIALPKKNKCFKNIASPSNLIIL